MPTYTYECKKCTSSFDLFHAMSASPRVKCSECGGPCRRLIGRGAGLIFKGSGFYETDYKKKSGIADSGSDSSGGKSDSKAEAKSESKAEANAETKAETKSEPKPDRKSGNGKKSPEKSATSAT